MSVRHVPELFLEVNRKSKRSNVHLKNVLIFIENPDLSNLTVFSIEIPQEIAGHFSFEAIVFFF